MYIFLHACRMHENSLIVPATHRYFKPAPPELFEDPEKERERRRKQLEAERIQRLIHEEALKEALERPKPFCKVALQVSVTCKLQVSVTCTIHTE